MNTTLHIQSLFVSLDEVWKELLYVTCGVDEQLINELPFKESWTIAQVATHIKKSNNAIIQGLQMKGKSCERNADERRAELQKTFLDFTAKFQSPDFIVPEKKQYQKETVVIQLENSIHQLKQLREQTDLSEIISLPIFGEITKLELLYFVLYHTQRHVYQLKNIVQIINTKN